MMNHRGWRNLGHGWIYAVFILAGLSPPAAAHVKWFAPYIVEAAPRPVSHTLSDPWFWTGLFLAICFFTATRIIEQTSLGERSLSFLNRMTGPLWFRLDDFVRAVIAGFFIAIFAVGGVYLTPDLHTPAEWVSWMQLLIAALIFFRITQPIAAVLIIALWIMALRDYAFFHLLDYLALGAAVAAYLVMESSRRVDLRKHRFAVLRWGIAIALMWSSLEKFAYPEWFEPLVQERPYLTFGLPRHVFIPMAGVAEFVLGFGMLWTPLVRRLSAIALLVIFTAAVYPFGRIDLIGHALIMAIIIAMTADQTPAEKLDQARISSLLKVPMSLGAALVVFAGGYWGIHAAIYGAEGEPFARPRLPHTHSLPD